LDAPVIRERDRNMRSTARDSQERKVRSAAKKVLGCTGAGIGVQAAVSHVQ
jgi:hypothetical protein